MISQIPDIEFTVAVYHVVCDMCHGNHGNVMEIHR